MKTALLVAEVRFLPVARFDTSKRQKSPECSLSKPGKCFPPLRIDVPRETFIDSPNHLVKMLKGGEDFEAEKEKHRESD